MDASKYHIKLTLGELRIMFNNFPYAIRTRFYVLYTNIKDIVKQHEHISDGSYQLIIEFDDWEMKIFIESLLYMKQYLNGIDVNSIINKYRMSEHIKKVKERYNRKRQ
jgi:hypothetical protein